MSSTNGRLLVFVLVSLGSLGALTMAGCAAHGTSYRVREPRGVEYREYSDHGEYGEPGAHSGYTDYSATRAYDLGYREGFQLGRDDARRGRPLDYARHREYRESGQITRERDTPRGSRDRRLYRDGFATGYNDAYRQFAWRR